MSVAPYDMGDKHTIFSNTCFIDCGKSTEEARSKGCVYDILANHYVHKSCYDDISTQSYMNEARPFVHCDEMWKRQYRAFTQNWRYIDAITADEEHTYHCANYLVAMADWTVIAGRDWRQEANTVEVGLAGCHDRALPRTSN
ncbi:hypothetical protein BKA67DRAFT_539765 [Truncatella angustata]|uniref:Uncharacterized protein n=1 Tax=Truncatella angustata TaxID=152316 RepID=A0A9P8RKW5_9PEZI|nr:uncharacterized protein BKA67DRAFT_539765 [Truncatella angustata]KAH6647936.1 hypothetical protein BKA67DRAFT_539765 [Truncatella angustata]